jgi:hypothetical protein
LRKAYPHLVKGAVEALIPYATIYKAKSINSSQMGIKSKICDIHAWKKALIS